MASPDGTSTDILFVGGGNMASALIAGLLARGTHAARIGVIDPSEDQRALLAARHGIATHASAADAGDAIAAAGVLVLAVKPQQMRHAVEALAPRLRDALVLSVAAGVRASDISRWLGGHTRIVRTMPNTPAMIGLGATGLAALPGTSDADRQAAEAILAAVGETVWVDEESKLDAVTALSGSGPAYVFRLIEAIAAGGEQLGLSREQAMRLTLQTFVGASQLAARSDEPPSVLRERVTSKGWTTAAALSVLEKGDVGTLFADALRAANDRSEELGREFGR
jgi:pyrroline-5-carboxylate reductase